MNKIDPKVLQLSRIITQEYDLCHYCLGRLFVNYLGLSDSKRLGTNILLSIKKQSTTRCFICKNIFDNLVYYVSMALTQIKKYEFSTFQAGVVLKSSMSDRDDIIKSRYNLHGSRSIKSDIINYIIKILAKKINAKLDIRKPDITILINLNKEICSVMSAHIFLFSRYTKTIRGIKQHDVKSNIVTIQNIITDLLDEQFDIDDARYLWVGSESSQSLVLGNGRPFFVKLVNPKKRPKPISILKNKGVVIQDTKIVFKFPNTPVKIITSVYIILNTHDIVPSSRLVSLHKLANSSISIPDMPKISKKIHSIFYRRLDSHSIKLHMKVDGGFPIQKFIESCEIIPNLSKLLGTSCTCVKFDIHQVDMID